MRYRVTTVLLNARRGSEQYQSMNSRIAWSYDRWELGEVKLFKTADFDCSRSGSFKTVFGLRLRLFLPIQAVCAARRPWEIPPHAGAIISIDPGNFPEADFPGSSNHFVGKACRKTAARTYRTKDAVERHIEQGGAVRQFFVSWTAILLRSPGVH